MSFLGVLAGRDEVLINGNGVVDQHLTLPTRTIDSAL